MEITGKIKAYVTDSLYRQKGFAKALKGKDGDGLCETLAFTHAEMESEGWTLVGHAEIKINLLDDIIITKNVIDSLRQKKASILANAQFEANQIEGEIQSLLAIENET